MTEEYKITSSPSWKWLRGMIDTEGAQLLDDDDNGLRIWSDPPGKIQAYGSRGWFTSYPSDDDKFTPDLTNHVTQGAIIFGIFQPLGIYVSGSPGRACANHERWAVDSTFHSPLAKSLLSGKLDGHTNRTLPELITVVFQALDRAGAE